MAFSRHHCFPRSSCAPRHFWPPSVPNMQRATRRQFLFPLTVPSRIPLGEVGYSNPRADVSCCTEAPCARESAGAKGKFWGQPELARSRQDAPRTSEALSRCAGS